MSRSRKLAVSLAAVALTSSLTLTGLPTESMAAPVSAPTLGDAKAQIARLEAESKAIEESYNGKAVALQGAYQALAATQRKVSVQHARVTAVSADAGAAIQAALAGKPTSSTTRLRDYVLSADRLAQLTRTRDAQAEKAAAAQERLGKIAADGDAKAREGDDFILRLAPEHQSALEAEQTAQREVSSATARDFEEALSAPAAPVRADQLAAESSATDGQQLSILGSIANTRIRKVVAYAMSRVGRSQYVWGAEGPWRFDCSGLTLASYRQIGVKLPHSSRVQARRGRWVSRYNLRAGDLILYYSPVSHVALYAGSGYIVHARNTRVDIVLQSFRSYPARYNSARRILG